MTFLTHSSECGKTLAAPRERQYLGVVQLVERLLWERRFLLNSIHIMLDTTHLKGQMTELHCLQDFIGLGYPCSVPFGDNTQYDVLVDINDKIYKIQCKSSTWAKDTVEPETAFYISLTRQTTNTKRTVKYNYSENQVDFFYTWFEGQGYLVSIQEANGSSFRWRYEYPSAGQKTNIHIADSYKIEEVINSLII